MICTYLGLYYLLPRDVLQYVYAVVALPCLSVTSRCSET